MSDKKAALILGATRGLGLGLARQYAAAGYTVYATQRSHSEALAEAVVEAKGAIHVREADVTDYAQIEKLAGSIHPEKLDVAVINAGVYGGSDQALEDLTIENVSDIIQTNALGPINAARAILPCMKDGGVVGMMSSKMGSIADSSGGSNLYRLSKVSQNMLARSLYEKHAKPRGIAVVSLHPGWVQTDMGGANALIDVDTSVAGMIDVLANADAGAHRFVAYDGQDMAW